MSQGNVKFRVTVNGLSRTLTMLSQAMRNITHGWPEFLALDAMRWPFLCWAVRSRPFDWRID